MSSKQFGGRLTEKWRSLYKTSPNWKDGAFKNLTKTRTGIDWKQIPGILCKQIRGHKEGLPKSSIPILPFDKNAFLKPSEKAKFIWYGHSVILMRLNNQTILIDPMLGSDASPIAPAKTKRFSNNSLNIINDLPEIDLMVLTHDHYDHLDYESIKRLKAKTNHYFVSLGIKRHLIRWGIDESRIEEFDWWDSRSFNNIKITFTPTRHFSGRGITSLAKCLWGGWAFKTATENIWFSGDGGYANHFKEIGKRLGPFDFAMMECGQYCDDWSQIHMFPNESVQAAIDSKVRVAMPVHWGGFKLSYQHAWFEPVEEFAKEAEIHSLPYITPQIGELFDATTTTKSWWTKFK
jgi:L-ascorbate metabolism protein UlaG (beta-lactamase superfamily)